MNSMFHVELPGVPTEDISVEYMQNCIRLKAVKNERPLERLWEVPAKYDLSKTKLKHEYGVLYFTLHESEDMKPKQLIIN